MTEMEEFITLYHSIDGETIKDKRKHFNEFLKLLKSSFHKEEDLNTFAKLITPKTALEEIFRIDVLIELKRRDILLQELRSCNAILVKKLLKDWKLFEEIFSNVDADDLVNNILPHLSYSLKLKVLNGICKNLKNENLLDEYFVMLQRKYGLKIATFILPGCSIDLIKSTISTYHLKLSNSQLKYIFKKNKPFVEYYFDEIKKKYENIKFSEEYHNVLKYISKTNPDIYWKLCEKHQLQIKFGKHATPNMLKSNKNIIRKGNNVFETFHFLQMYKTMKKEGMLHEFLVNLYPETHDKFSETCLENNLFRFIQKGSRTQQYNLISTCFTQKYNRKLLDYHSYFTENLLKVTPLKEREQILDIKVKDNENLFYLYGPTTSIPVLKERLQHTSNATKRAEQLTYLYQSCAVNKDENALLDVLRYILSRHKNDTNFLPSFLDNLVKWPDISNLSEQHWQYMINISKILEMSRQRYWGDDAIYEKYIYHLMKNNKSCYKVVNDLIKGMVDDKKFSFYCVRDKKYQKPYWDEIAKCIDTYKGHEKYQMLCIRFLSFIIYDIKNKPKVLLNYRRFFDQLKTDDWESSSIITAGITCDEEVLHNLFWKFDAIDNAVLRWYVKHRPEKLKENISKVLNSVGRYKFEKFLKELKLILDPDTVQKIKTQALDHIHNEDYEKAKVFVRAISVLAPEAFVEIITPLLSLSDGKIDLEESTDKITFQTTVANSLANIRDPLVSFPLILKFCVGDYLKFGLPGLYSITSHTPELYIEDFLSKLSNRAVSVRKHMLYLARHLLTAEDFYELLKEWSDTETNLSMRNIILRKTLEYVIENPSDRFWTLLKTNLNTLDENDRELYDFLLKFQTFPLDYLPEYLEIIYRMMSNHPDAEISKKKFQLIDNISIGSIDKLNESFIKEVIRETVCVEPVSNFHWKCVFYTTGEKQLRLFEENFQTFEKYVDQNNFDIEDVAIRSKVINFVTQFYCLALELKQGGDLIQKFMSSWISVFKPQNFNREFMLIEFANLYFNSKFDAYETGLKINGLLCDYIGKFNRSVIHLFCQQLHNFIVKSCIKDEDKDLFNFIDGLSKNKNDGSIYIAVMYFLPETIPKSDNAYAKYVPIIHAIKSCDIPLVQYYFDSYLSGNEFI